MTQAQDWRGGVGDVWAAEWRRTDRAFAGLDAALARAIAAAAPLGPFRALDIGSGAGGTSIALATARPDATVSGVDLSAALVEVARQRSAGLANLSFVVGDVLDRAIGDGPFDLIVSRHGVMFFDVPAEAFATLHAATLPGGRIVFTCFADPALNDFAAPLARALGLRSPAAGDAPGPFAFADPRFVADLLAGAGWRVARLDRVSFPYRVGEGEHALDDAVDFLSRIGPAAAAMRGVGAAAREELVGGLRRYLAGFVADNAVDLRATAWLIAAEA